MRTKKTAIALIAVLLIAALAPTTLASATTRIHGHNFTVVERDGTESFVDLPPTGEPGSPGDRAVFVNPLYDESNTERVGSAYGECTLIEVPANEAPTLQCLVTVKLPGGTLTAQGVSSFSGPSDFAITGGTGEYKKARGQATVVDDEKAGVSRIHIDI